MSPNCHPTDAAPRSTLHACGRDDVLGGGTRGPSSRPPDPPPPSLFPVPGRLEVGAVFRRYGPAFFEANGPLTIAQAKVIHALAACRTATLGGHVEVCGQCGFRKPAYNSCRNRHCPKCQGARRVEWLQERQAELLPVPYFHVVFTLPHEIADLALHRHNQQLIYDLLFAAASVSLQQLAADPKHLGGKIGLIAVLHTWGQSLQHHPHLHVVVPGGALSPDGQRWLPCRKNFFLPVKLLSREFRRRFLEGLRQALGPSRKRKRRADKRLHFPFGQEAFDALLTKAEQIDWVVYIKPPVCKSEIIVKYLARYTYRVAIANDRLISMNDNQVSFHWKNYADNSRWEVMTLPAVEFIRRLMLHVLPKYFVRIRHYGFLSTRNRPTLLQKCRELLGCGEAQAANDQGPGTNDESLSPCHPVTLSPCQVCPHCGQALERLDCGPRPTMRQLLYERWPFDSS